MKIFTNKIYRITCESVIALPDGEHRGRIRFCVDADTPEQANQLAEQILSFARLSFDNKAVDLIGEGMQVSDHPAFTFQGESYKENEITRIRAYEKSRSITLVRRNGLADSFSVWAGETAEGNQFENDLKTLLKTLNLR